MMELWDEDKYKTVDSKAVFIHYFYITESAVNKKK